MYTLSAEKKLAVIAALVEGNSIRSINRMTDVDRNTITFLLAGCGKNSQDLWRCPRKRNTSSAHTELARVRDAMAASFVSVFQK